MRVCMVSQHLPPERGPSASMPALVGLELRGSGVECDYVAHPPLTPFGPAPVPGTWHVPPPGRSPYARSPFGRWLAWRRIASRARPAIDRADVVHLHGGGLIIRVAASLAERLGKPWVLSVYNAAIWERDSQNRRGHAHVVRHAAWRAFYTAALMERARSVGFGTAPASVIRAAVSPGFRPVTSGEREALRRSLGVAGPLLVLLKRMRPLAGHEVLIEAMPHLRDRHDGVQLVLAGDGEMRESLEALTARLGLAEQVRFLDTVVEAEAARWLAVADLFVLPSHVESWASQAVNALASGTPVISSDTTGGIELHDCFPGDVELVPRGDAGALAAAVARRLEQPRRVGASTRERLVQEFAPAAVARAYLEIYAACDGRSTRRR